MKNRNKFFVWAFLVSFIFCSIAYGADQKESSRDYLSRLDKALREVNIIYRNSAQKILPVSEGAKNMQVYIDNIKALTPPESLTEQHKMIVQALEKLKNGFELLVNGDRPGALALIKTSSDLLKVATKAVLDFGKKEGLIKNDAKSVQKIGGIR